MQDILDFMQEFLEYMQDTRCSEGLLIAAISGIDVLELSLCMTRSCEFSTDTDRRPQEHPAGFIEGRHVIA
jgi:hypothetical protein